VVNSVTKYDTLKQVISKTRYEAKVDSEICNGCQLCIDLCNFDAIEMIKPEGSKKYKAQIDPGKCWGCGVCYTACVPEAISLKLVRPPTYIHIATRA
jgi:heterodisulfide reductase subunit A-like polyferredoxin